MKKNVFFLLLLNALGGTQYNTLYNNLKLTNRGKNHL